MADRLKGKVAVVTGAGSERGIGREVALALAAEGAAVVVNDIAVGKDGVSGAEEVARAIVDAGGKAVASVDSITTLDGARKVIQTAVNNYGCIDILVNTAANWLCKPVLDHTEADWDGIMNVQLKGLFGCTRAAVAEMIHRGAGGRIITFTSGAAFNDELGPGGAIAYSTAKAGVAGFTNALALELEQYGITVNAISPVALTSMFPDERVVDGIQVTGPEYVAPVVVYLATEDAGGITGRFIWASGGEIRLLERPFRIPGEEYRVRKDGKWTVAELINVMPGLMGRR